tara:strand:- start:253 stop:498 length:246 start_codon:yes stop_codon:yes gene_type:complete
LKKPLIRINWPNNISTEANEGDDWFINAKKANINIPVGCLSGSCGACEIDVNGKTIRPCITSIELSDQKLNIEFTSDPYWN